MTDPNKRAPPALPHLYTLGQAVRVKGGVLPNANTYLITAMLPPLGDAPQYRIRCEIEKFERMATQANLEPVEPTSSKAADLRESSFKVSPTASAG